MVDKLSLVTMILVNYVIFLLCHFNVMAIPCRAHSLLHWDQIMELLDVITELNNWYFHSRWNWSSLVINAQFQTFILGMVIKFEVTFLIRALLIVIEFSFFFIAFNMAFTLCYQIFGKLQHEIDAPVELVENSW